LKKDFYVKLKPCRKQNYALKRRKKFSRFKKLNFVLRRGELPLIIRAVSAEKQTFKYYFF